MISRITRFVLILSLLAVILSACASKPAEPTTVRIGTQPWIGYGPWWIAKEKGIFEKYGLKAELVDFLEDKEVNAAFASGQMDAANLATHTAIKLYAAGLSMKVLILEDASYQADAVIAPASVASIADLKGKKVAYEEGTTSDLLINYALKQNGMSIADITPVFMPASDAGSTLIAKSVDVAVTYEPYISAAIAGDANLKVLYSAAERPGLISDVLAVRGNLPEETKQKLLKVWDEALAYYKSNPEEAKAIIATAVGSAPEELVTAFDGIQFYSIAENKSQFGGELPQTLADVADVAQSIGMFETAPDLSAILDTAAYGK